MNTAISISYGIASLKHVFTRRDKNLVMIELEFWNMYPYYIGVFSLVVAWGSCLNNFWGRIFSSTSINIRLCWGVFNPSLTRSIQTIGLFDNLNLHKATPTQQLQCQLIYRTNPKSSLQSPLLARVVVRLFPRKLSMQYQNNTGTSTQQLRKGLPMVQLLKRVANTNLPRKIQKDGKEGSCNL